VPENSKDNQADGRRTNSPPGCVKRESQLDIKTPKLTEACSETRQIGESSLLRSVTPEQVLRKLQWHHQKGTDKSIRLSTKCDAQRGPDCSVRKGPGGTGHIPEKGCMPLCRRKNWSGEPSSLSKKKNPPKKGKEPVAIKSHS